MNKTNRAEMVFITEDDIEYHMSSQCKEVMSIFILLSVTIQALTAFIMVLIRTSLLSISFFINEIEDDQSIVVGAHFTNTITFKQVLQSKAVKKDFGVKIVLSNKTRVIAICSHKGCAHGECLFHYVLMGILLRWELEATHLCPSGNRVVNK